MVLLIRREEVEDAVRDHGVKVFGQDAGLGRILLPMVAVAISHRGE